MAGLTRTEAPKGHKEFYYYMYVVVRDYYPRVRDLGPRHNYLGPLIISQTLRYTLDLRYISDPEIGLYLGVRDIISRSHIIMWIIQNPNVPSGLP